MAQQWIRFTLILRPFYDPATGQVLASVDGRKNRLGVDEFRGGGKVYPDLTQVVVLEWYQKEADLLVCVEGEQADIGKLTTNKALTYRVSPKEFQVCSTGLAAKALSPLEANAVKSVSFDTAPIGVTT